MKFVLMKYSFVLSAAVMGTLKLPSPCSAKIVAEEENPGALQDKSKLPSLRGVVRAARGTTTAITVTRELNSHDALVARKLQTVTANLTNGVPRYVHGAFGSLTYYALRNVPAGQYVTCTTSGGTGAVHLDMILKAIGLVTADCSSDGLGTNGGFGTNASCTAGPMVNSTDVFIGLQGIAAYANVTLKCYYPTSVQNLQNTVPLTGLSGARQSNTYFALRNVTAGSLATCTTSGGTGNVDLYVKIGSLSYIRNKPDCSSTDDSENEESYSGNEESCAVRIMKLTDVFIDLYGNNGNNGYTAVTLTCYIQSAAPTQKPTRRPTQPRTKRPTTKPPTRRPTRPPTKTPTKPTKA